MTAKSRTAFSTDLLNSLPDNTTGAITPAVLRQRMTDLLDSAFNKTDDHVPDVLGYTPENAAYRGAPSGYASLGADGLVPTSQLPSSSVVGSPLRYDIQQSLSATEQGRVLAAIGVADVRRTTLLNAINAAKALASRQPVPNGITDGFGGNDGIGGTSSGYSLDTGNRRVVNGTTAGTQVAQATGTAIGDMTAAGGLAAAFDGNTSQVYTACATKVAASGYVGKNYSASPKIIGQAQVFSSSDIGFDGTTGATTITLTLYGKQTAPANGTDGTVLGTWSGADAAALSPTITSTDATTAWNYVWVNVATTQGTPQVEVAEVQFFGPSTSTNMTVIGTPWSLPDATITTLQATAVIEAIDAATLNTDVTLEVSRDGGTTWSVASLTQYHSLGTKVLVESPAVSVAGQPAGSSATYRYKTLNGKRVTLHGLALKAA